MLKCIGTVGLPAGPRQSTCHGAGRARHGVPCSGQRLVLAAVVKGQGEARAESALRRLASSTFMRNEG